MSADDLHTQRAAEALESAGFEKAKAQAIVATATAVTDDRIAAIVGNLATKEQVEALATRMDVEGKATHAQFEVLTTRMEAQAEATQAQFEALTTRMEVQAKATQDQAEATRERLAVTATKDELKSATTELRAEIAVEFKELYRHLWIMSAGIVALTVTLVKLIP